MGIPLVDMQAVHGPLRQEILDAMAAVIDSGAFILGPDVNALEAETAEYSHASHGIGVSSGTDALLAALMALDVGAGDDVVTTPYSFFATAGVIARLGARPVFCDIEADSFNLDPAKLEAAMTPKTKAIIVVHLFGRSADMDAIGAIAEAHGVPVIEDAAQAIGAEWKGQRVGGIGRVGCFSFFPTKNLGGMGDGGMITTSDDALAERLRSVRKHGAKQRYQHTEVGGNFRLDTLQAAIIRVKMKRLDGWTDARAQAAGRYDALFAEAGLTDRVGLPDPGPYRSVWNQYVIRLPGQRDAVREALKAAGIGCSVYYPLALSEQPCFADLGHGPGSFPEAERAARETLAIPVAPGLTADQQREVVDAIAGAVT